jgi:poly-gamma-glutamate synthesis protein (capsule biosynthesis protein)
MGKHTKKIYIPIYAIILVILIIIGIIVGYNIEKIKNIANYNEEQNEISQVEEKQEDEEKEEKEEIYTASMIMVGDYLIHSSIYNEANRNANYNGYDFKPMLEYIKPIVSEYDIKYYNQETILGGSEIGVSDYPTFNSPFEAGDAMIDAGFNLVSLATNHTMDRGRKAVLNSRNYWNNQENVLAVGSYSSEEEKNEIQIAEVNNIKYTMLNYTYGTNGITVPSDAEYLVNVWPTDLSINDPQKDTKYQAYKEQVKKDIEQVKDKVDVLIVAMHWGIEYTNTPTAYEKDAAEFLASEGVNIVIGTHPHVVQPVTWIDDTLVIYSLGNFISAQTQDLNYNKVVGLMSSLEITKTVKDGESKILITNVKNELIYTYYKSYKNFKVIPFSQMNSTYLSNYEQIYEKYKKVIQMYDEDMYVVPLAEN